MTSLWLETKYNTLFKPGIATGYRLDEKVEGFFLSFLDGSVVVNKTLALGEKHIFPVHAEDKAKHISG